MEETMSEGFTIANFRSVAHGLQEGQFAIGERKKASGLRDLDTIAALGKHGPARKSSANYLTERLGRICELFRWLKEDGLCIAMSGRSCRSRRSYSPSNALRRPYRLPGDKNLQSPCSRT